MNTLENFGFKILEIIFTVFLMVAIFFNSSSIERSLMPVVKDFTINRVIKVEGGIEVSGTLFKQRACKFKDLIIYTKTDGTGVRKPVNYKFKDDYTVSSRAVDTSTDNEEGQQWGPWVIFIPSEFDKVDTEFYVVHECHSLYDLYDKIGTLRVTYSDGKLGWIQ